MKQFFKDLGAINIRSTLLAALFIISCAVIFVQFLAYNEHRSLNYGFEFIDPAFDLIPAHDVSLPIFLVTYGSLVVYLIVFRMDRELFSRIMMTYGFLILFRMISLSILPLRPPEEIIFLDDPFLNTFIYPGRIDTDLFFSGHTALLLAIYFSSGRKWYFLIMAAALGLLLMVQRCHYSIDILGAIPFAYFASRMTEQYLQRWPFRL
jgi:hypothetical protein